MIMIIFCRIIYVHKVVHVRNLYMTSNIHMICEEIITDFQCLTSNLVSGLIADENIYIHIYLFIYLSILITIFFRRSMFIKSVVI